MGRKRVLEMGSKVGFRKWAFLRVGLSLSPVGVEETISSSLTSTMAVSDDSSAAILLDDARQRLISVYFGIWRFERELR